MTIRPPPRAGIEFESPEGRMLRTVAAACLLFLTSLFGEEPPQTTAANTRAVIDRFNAAFDRHDADALALLLTDDTVFGHLALARWPAHRRKGRGGRCLARMVR